MNSEDDKKRTVAVIGVGLSGICALKHLKDSDQNLEPVAFERNFWSGGLWVYNDQSDYDDYGLPIHSAMYNELKTNIPKQLMEFPGFPYPEEWTNSYLTRQQSLEYLDRFVEHHGLKKYIKTHTIVTRVCPVPVRGSELVKWKVTYSDIRLKDTENVQIFDAVFVCSGQCFVENIPDIPGIEKFKGRVIHSKRYRRPEHFEGLRVALLGCRFSDIPGIEKFKGRVIHSKRYRRPEHFEGLRVALLGCRFSGEDLCLQILPLAKKIYACHSRTDMSPSFPAEVEQRPPFVRMNEHSIIFPDGSEQEVDAVIFCTGYNYSYPFMDDNIIEINNGRVTPLYKHMIHIKYPNLIFLGIPRLGCYFPHYHEMSKLAVLVIEGKVTLPTQDEMSDESEADYQALLKEGIQPKNGHYMIHRDRQWQYNKELAKMGGFEPLPAVLQSLWEFVVKKWKGNLLTFRNLNYDITETQFKCLNPEDY